MLTDEQWHIIQPFLHTPPVAQHPACTAQQQSVAEGARRRPGRPPLDQRLVLEAILWKLVTRSPWRSIRITGREAFPKQGGGNPSHQLCYQVFSRWKQDGRLSKIIFALLRDVRQRGNFDFEHACANGLVWYKREGNQFLCCVSAEHALMWQVRVSLFYYQYIACIMDIQAGLTLVVDPLLELLIQPSALRKLLEKASGSRPVPVYTRQGASTRQGIRGPGIDLGQHEEDELDLPDYDEELHATLDPGDLTILNEFLANAAAPHNAQFVKELAAVIRAMGFSSENGSSAQS